MKISGQVDLCGPELIEGWLYFDIAPATPIRLQVWVGADLLGECAVDLFRPDLEAAGYGDGYCGFSFPVPDEFRDLRFSETKLRLLDGPVFMLPSDSTVIAASVRG